MLSCLRNSEEALVLRQKKQRDVGSDVTREVGGWSEEGRADLVGRGHDFGFYSLGEP